MNDVVDVYEIAERDRRLISIVVELLTKCNEKCEHCYIPSHDGEGIGTEKVITIIKEFRKQGGAMITFTGGEIFLRDDIWDIICAARKEYLRVFLLTNATFITTDVAKRLSDIGVSEISTTIYSMSETTHDSITKTGGSLAKTIAGIMNAKKYKIPVTIKTPVMEKNKFDYVEVGKFCKENGFEHIFSPVIFSKSNGDKSPHKFCVNADDLPIVVNDMKKEGESYEGIDIENDSICRKLKYSMAIDQNGDAYPCNCFFVKLGNVLTDSFEKIWDSRKIKKIQGMKIGDLESCATCEFSHECTRCPGIALLEENTLLGCSKSAKAMAIIRHKLKNEEV